VAPTHRISSATRRGSALTSATVLIAVGLLIVLIPVGRAAPSHAVVGVSTSGTAPVCNSPTTTSPSAVLIPTSNPSGSATANGSLTLAYQVAVVNYSSSLGQVTVYVPSMTGSFPLVPSGTLQEFIPPKIVNITATGWSNATTSGTTTTKVLPTGVNFTGTGTARLSSQKIAVMASTGYSGQVQVEFRWQWTLVSTPGASPATSGWTVPSTNSSSSALPSLFYPAPYIGISSVGNWPAPAGSNYSVRLNGAVASTSFRMVLEWASNGTEIWSHVENSTSGVTVFPAWVLLASNQGAAVGPGTYLIHVHDVCGAITHSFSVGVTNETVTCGAHTLSPAAISIPAPAPTKTVPSKGTVQVFYQIAIVNYTSSLGKVTIDLPSSKGVFPILPSGTLNVSVAAATVTLSGGGWSSQFTGTYTAPSSISFNTSQQAHFSTSKLAVMASGGYNGKVALEVKWKWKVSGKDGSWTTPSYSYAPSYLPSIFTPAPYVPVLGTSANATAGSNFTVVLGGAVAQTMFRMVVEYPSNGTELRHTDEYTAPNATTFNATILLSNMVTNQPLAPGSYLVHVHDVCDAIIHSISIAIGNGSTGASGAPVGGGALGPTPSPPGAFGCGPALCSVPVRLLP